MKFTNSFFSAMLYTAVICTAFIGGSVISAKADAKQLRYALGTPSGSPAHEGVKRYAEAVEEHTKGELSVKIYPLSLLSFAEASAGVRDGLADMAWLLTPYNQAEFPHINYISETSMLVETLEGSAAGKEGMAFGAAVSEFIFESCPECLQEFAAQNQVYTGHSAGTSYGLLCSEPVRSLEEMRGKRIRVGASNFSRWAEALGADPVTLSSNDMYEALSQGVIDCTVLATPEVLNFGLGEVVTDATMAVPGGPYPFAGYQINKDTWRALTDKQRKGMLRASAVGSAAIAFQYYDNADKAEAHMLEAGAEFHQAGEQLVDRTRAFVRKDMPNLQNQYAERYGIERGEEMMKTFRPLLDKWVRLVEDVENVDQLADLYWQEFMSDIDVSTYGM